MTISLVKGLHRELLRGVRGEDQHPGAFRDRQVWLGPRESDIRSARLVPPPPLEIAPCLADLDAYLDERGPDEGLVRVALAHYQLEAIHPFADGNGRTGRLLLALQLVWEGVLERPCLYVSPVLERKRAHYYDGLLHVSTRGVYLPWVAFFVEAVVESARETLDRLHRLRAVRDEFASRLRREQSQKPLLLAEQLFAYPYVTVPRARLLLDVPQSATAQQTIDKLVAKGILEQSGHQSRPGRGRPPKLYRCPEILEIIRE